MNRRGLQTFQLQTSNNQRGYNSIKLKAAFMIERATALIELLQLTS